MGKGGKGAMKSWEAAQDPGLKRTAIDTYGVNFSIREKRSRWCEMTSRQAPRGEHRGIAASGRCLDLRNPGPKVSRCTRGRDLGA